MESELSDGRARALEAERLRAFRESARQFAHELKNPLTPMAFAVARLERETAPQLADVVEVLRTETHRLDQMARSFAQFGRLPEGAPSDVDVGELVRYTARAVVPPSISVELEVPAAPSMIRGHHDALQRALSNVLLNAVDAVEACRDVRPENGRRDVRVIRIAVTPAQLNGSEAVSIAVRDSGCGIDPERIENIWEPYVTSKPGGTGLGLAIARQTVLAHSGSVAAESVPGVGTEVRLVLPRSGVLAHSS
jgi:signal transduction histidine kinase